jgi:DNA-binding transcriptional ArsR family regulator
MLEISSALDLTVGRSTVRQAILALLMDDPGCRLHLREIQRRAATSPGTASRELAKLVAAGLVEREAEGAQVYFRASNSPFATMLRSILLAMPSPERGPRPRRLPRPGRTKATAAPAADQVEFEPAVANSGIASAAAGSIASAAAGSIASPVASAEPVAPASPAEIDPSPGDTVIAALAEPAVKPRHVAARVFEPAPRQRSQAPSEQVAGADTLESPAPSSADSLGLKAASRFAESVRLAYGDTLRGVYLYGARAGGSAAGDADVETIIVLDQVDHYGAELEKTSQMCASLSHEFGVLVSRIFVSESTWEGGPDGRLPLVRSEAVAL